MAVKTNAMRQLDQKKLSYQVHEYGYSDAISGMDVVEVLNEDPNQVFKTLVTIGKSNTHYVFVIPVCHELDLKKAAKIVKEKSIAMVKSKELLGLTGYIHGGCSPIGMKKQFLTVFHISATSFPTIICSGGKIGYQIETSLENIKQVIRFEIADIIK